MQHIPVGSPLEKVAMDIMGPFPISDTGNRYILVISDYFTRWVEAYAIPDMTAQVVADKFVSEFITRYGIPDQIHTDQGRDFMSNLFKEMAKLLDVYQTRTTPYHPMSDGLVERLNRTIQQMLKSFISENASDWEDHLPYVLMAYRSSIQESTGCTPNLLMFGRELSIPIDLLVGHPPHSPPSLCTIQYVEWLKSAMRRAFDFAKKHMNTSVLRQKKTYNKRCKENHIKTGDWVWLYDHVQSKTKLGKDWQGPFLVLQQITEVTFKIQKDEHTRFKVVHKNDLKKYISDNIPHSWVPQDTMKSKHCSTQTDPLKSKHQSIQTEVQPERQSIRTRKPRRPYSPD